jgi:RES domain-containing protein
VNTLWRISNHADLGGWGGKKLASRWTSLGRRVVYMAESPAGAMLEVLVHLQFEDGELPDTYQLLEISVPDEQSVVSLPAPQEWKERQELTQEIGDAWLGAGMSLLARVPSAILPRTWNVLLNPEHSQALEVKIESVNRERFDNRLFQFGAREGK